MNTTQEITTGTRIHSILYGGRDGTVVAIHGEAQPETIVAFPGYGLTSGGNAEYDIIWDNCTRSQRVPECIIRGVQWRILDQEPATPEQIQLLYAAASECARQIAQRDADKAKAKQDATQRFLAEHPNLTPGDGAKTAAKNIRTQLKQSFKLVKFSVRSDSNSVNIGWTDGPTQHEVEQITRNYSHGSFDSSDDSYRYDSGRAWPFGGASYLFDSRSYSDEVREDAIRIIAERFHESCDLEQERYRALRKTTIPAGHKLTSISNEGFPTFTTAPR